MDFNINQLVYIVEVIILSILLFLVVGGIFGTNDGTISYFLSLIASHFIIKELDSIKKS